MRPVSSEFLVLKAAALFVFWVGLYPAPFLNVMDVSVTSLIQHTTGGLAASQLP
jgi:NADH:ubiquinone oxidoreductase subunit 4 (subunit M)